MAGELKAQREFLGYATNCEFVMVDICLNLGVAASIGKSRAVSGNSRNRFDIHCGTNLLRILSHAQDF
jgi:hypothetical protein